MSAYVCGCDPDNRKGPHRCDHYPDCPCGRVEVLQRMEQGLDIPKFLRINDSQFKVTAMPDAREERIEALYSSPTGEVRVVDVKTGGMKGQKLARFSLLPFDALWLIAEHFGKGASKYADRNWEKGYAWSLSYDAMMRHAVAFWHRQDNGVDTKFGPYKHIVAAAWHAIVLIVYSIRGIGTDDRPLNATIEGAKE